METTFLFQTGSIRRLSLSLKERQSLRFLFQTGSIRRYVEDGELILDIDVSIPNWFD